MGIKLAGRSWNNNTAFIANYILYNRVEVRSGGRDVALSISTSRADYSKLMEEIIEAGYNSINYYNYIFMVTALGVGINHKDFKLRLIRLGASFEDNIFVEILDSPTKNFIDASEMDDDLAEEFEDFYWDLLENEKETFSGLTGLSLFQEGANGKHICVKYSYLTVINFGLLHDLAQNMENHLIKEMNEHIKKSSLVVEDRFVDENLKLLFRFYTDEHPDTLEEYLLSKSIKSLPELMNDITVTLANHKDPTFEFEKTEINVIDAETGQVYFSYKLHKDEDGNYLPHTRRSATSDFFVDSEHPEMNILKEFLKTYIQGLSN